MLSDRRNCAVMGILNVTPDSFSDGGRYVDLDDAIAHGLRMHAEGAEVIDVGGESTRPGAGRVDAAQEIARVLPVIEALAAEGVPLSVDTTRAEVALAAVGAGAGVINDVSGGLADPAMTPVVAETGAQYVIMHWRGHSVSMSALATYGNVVADVGDELRARVDAAVAAGVDESVIVLDPGLGFAKRAEHDWALLNSLPTLISLGFPVLVGASRKRFLGALLGDGRDPRQPAGREDATAAITTLAAWHGAAAVRVHDVRRSRDALAVVRSWRAGEELR